MDIFDEARTELKQQKLHEFIMKYYKAFITLTVLVLGIVSIIVFTNYRHRKHQEELAKNYYDLFISGQISSKFNDVPFGELIKFRDSIFMPFAEYYYVNSAVKDGKYERAVQLLFDLNESTKKYPEISNMMKVRLAGIVMQQNMKTYHYKVAEILKKAIKKKDTPYYHMMKLLLGQLLLELGTKDEALKTLKELNQTKETPEDIKLFSGAILSNYLE